RTMSKVEWEKCQQTVEDLRRASRPAAHPRGGERSQPLSLIAPAQLNATACAAHIGRQDETVLRWVHRYNRHGPDALTYRHSGGRAPLLTSNRQNRSSMPLRGVSRPTMACPATCGR